MTDKWLAAMDEGKLIGTVLVDLRKAFDSVNHSLLLRKLEIYGCSPLSLSWFASYIDDRSQYVSLRNVHSDLASVKCGVPQGSILGPLLFLLFINDLPLHLEHCDVDLFADDTNMYVIDKCSGKAEL